MAKTLLTRISKLNQYKPSERKILWEDKNEIRWNSIYRQLKINDNAIFIAPGKLLIGTITKIETRKNILCTKVQEVTCSNDQLLQLHEITPELISRVKANFQPFIHPEQVNIKQLINDAKAKRFVSYYIISDQEKYVELKPKLNINDRVVLIDTNGRLENVKLNSSTGLKSFPASLNINIGVQGMTLDKILDINKSKKGGNLKSNNVLRIQNIIKSIKEKGFYQFKTFFSYYDGLYNKRAYGKEPILRNYDSIKLKPDEYVYKVSMSRKDIDDEAYKYFSDKNLIVVHGNTKAKETSLQSQGETFSKKMKIGDYFYLCRENDNIEVIGRITGNAEECEYDDFGSRGWLERSYNIIKESRREGPYNGVKKWWTPNDNSTCILIPKQEIQLANENIFLPFFGTRFEYEASTNFNEIKSNNFMSSPLNQILYGPPGTGKTYNTINKSVLIANPEFNFEQSRVVIKNEFDRLVKEGFIVFTTFHQSMSYEDFIEGIKPIAPNVEGQQVVYKVIPGILKGICNRIKNFEKITFNKPGANITVSNFDELYSAFIIRLKEIISDLEENETYSFEYGNSRLRLIKIEGDKSIIVSGEAPGSTKKITKNKLEKFYNRFVSQEVISDTAQQLNEAGTDKREATLYFTIFKTLKAFEASVKVDKGNNTSVKLKQNFVLIIDEINRGNVSQIFGELITLIEDDKRLGNDEAIEVTLPYSKEKFGVPSNLFIIGTMNTADRSVEALDTALRRRFSFEEMLPDQLLIPVHGTNSSENSTLNDIDLRLLFNTINKRIEKLLDKDHLIGHSYFMSVSNLNELKIIFQNKIIPLLQEYFFGDYGKIGLIIGKDFFEPNESNDESIFSVFDDYDTSGFDERMVFKNKNIEKMPDDDFKNAIISLMNKR